MNTQELELAIDRAQWLVRRLTEERTLRWHGEPGKADKAARYCLISLDEVADLMGFAIVSKADMNSTDNRAAYAAEQRAGQ